ncbi:hypothetical protein Q1B84_004769 [Salmonella enterica]
MRKYIFNLGVVASLVAGGISVSSAAPTNGTVDVTGTLKESTCTVTLTTSSIMIPPLTVAAINSGPEVSQILTVNGPQFSLAGCSDSSKRVYMSLRNGSSTSSKAGNIGLFTYDANKDSANGPLYFKYFANAANPGALDLNGLGQQAVTGDSRPVIRIYKLNPNVAQNYSGGYKTNVTMNYVYR